MVELEKTYKIYYKVHQARAHYLFYYLLSIIAIGTSIWIYFNLMKDLKIIVGGTIIAIIIFLLTELICVKEATLYLASNGITRERGIFGKEYVTINYEDVLRTAVTQTAFQRILKHGNLGIDTAGMEEAELEFKNIPNPQIYKQAIDELIDRSNTVVKKK